MRIGRWGLLIAGIIVAIAAGMASLNQLSDWDMFHHLAYGRDILRRGGFAAEDPFLFPLAGLPSGPQPSWLGSVLVYGSWRLLGENGPLALASGLAGLIFFLLFRDGVEDDDRLDAVALAFVPLVLTLAVFRSRAVPRPEMIANLFLVALMMGLHRFASLRWWWFGILSIGIPLWANIHQSVLAGLAVLVIFLVVNATLLLIGRGKWTEWTRLEQGTPILAGAVAGVASTGFLTPVGFFPFRTPLVIFEWAAARLSASTGETNVVASDPVALFQSAITELQPMGQHWLGPFGALVGLALLALIAAWRRPNLGEVVTGVAFVVLASRLLRLSAMAALVIAPIAMRSLREALDRLPWRRWWVTALAGTATLAIVGYTTWAMLTHTDIRFGLGLDRRLPIRSVDYLRSIGFTGRMFNTFHFGGFLEWMLDQKTYQDGRGNLPPGEMRAALLGPGAYSAFEELDRKYRFDALVVEYPRWEPSAIAVLSAVAPARDWGADPTTWALVAFDDGGQVYLRRDGRYAAQAARDQFRFARPSVPITVSSGDAAAAMADYERSVREAPGCSICRLRLGMLFLEAGRTALAEALLESSLRGLPVTRMQAEYGLAKIAAGKGDLLTAERRLRSVVAASSSPAEPRRSLAAIMADQGRSQEALRELRKNLDGGQAERADLELAIELAKRTGDRIAAQEFERRLASQHR